MRVPLPLFLNTEPGKGADVSANAPPTLIIVRRFMAEQFFRS